MATLTKNISESRIFEFDYSNFQEILGGDTVASAVITSSPVGLTVGGPSISATNVKVQISGGLANITYVVKCVATTTATYKLVVCGDLKVTDCT